MYLVTNVEGVLDHLGLHQVLQQLDVLAPQAFLAWSGIEHFDVLLEVGERLAQLFEDTHGCGERKTGFGREKRSRSNGGQQEQQ